jgi:hypothetical protein
MRFRRRTLRAIACLGATASCDPISDPSATRRQVRDRSWRNWISSAEVAVGTGASNASRSFAAAAAAPAIKSRLNVARELGCVMCAGHGSNHASGDKAKYRMAYTCTGGVSDKNGSAAAVH